MKKFRVFAKYDAHAPIPYPDWEQPLVRTFREGKTTGIYARLSGSSLPEVCGRGDGGLGVAGASGGRVIAPAAGGLPSASGSHT